MTLRFDERLRAGWLLSRRSVVRGFKQWFLFGAVLASLGCERKQPSVDIAPGISATAVPPAATSVARPGASTRLAAGAPADAPSPLPGLTLADVLNCKGMSAAGFHITVEGDGAPQVMREGSRIETLAGTLRYCAAAGQKAAPHQRLTLFGCASRSDAARSCLSIAEQTARYLDREGREWSLELGIVNATLRGDALEGTAQLTARRAHEVKQLKISFRAGTKIPAVPERESPYFMN